MDSGSVQDEIQGIDEDICEIAEQNPRLAKWFTATPEIAAKKRKEKEKKDKKKAAKATSQAEAKAIAMSTSKHDDSAAMNISSDSDDSSTDQLAEKENDRPAKKPKTLANITAYIEICNPTRTLKEKPSSSPRGPFFFNLDTSRLEFLQSLASCSVHGHYAPTIAAINQQQLFWKQQVPANNKKKPLANEAGYLALISKLTELAKKGKDTTIILSLPPLARVAINPTDIVAGSRGVDLEQEEFKDGPMGSTIREQQQAICEGTAVFLDQLRVKYPIGADPRFPNKRIYSLGPNVLWELTSLKLQVWATHLDKGQAMLDAPPNSVHFSESQRLRIPTKAVVSTEPATTPIPAPPVAVHPAPNPMYPAYGGYPQYFPPHYPYPMHPQYNLPPPTDAYLAHYTPAPPYPPPAPYLNAPLPPALPAPNVAPGYGQGLRPQTPIVVHNVAPGSAPTSPLKITLPCPILLDEFCDHYGIDDEDRARLAKLKVQPGDKRVEKLNREDWQGHAGFAKLAWDDFLIKHKLFVSEVKAGQWDTCEV